MHVLHVRPGLLRMIKEKVMARDSHFSNPLRNLTLFAHSMGGLVSKLLINELIDDNEATGDWFNRFVSVSTPFFGTENHMDRYYRRVKFINFLLSGADKVVSLHTNAAYLKSAIFESPGEAVLYLRKSPWF